MSNFIELKDIYDKEVLVNVDHIIYIKNDKGTAFISLTGDTHETNNYFIVADYKEVMRKITIVSTR